MIALEQAQSKIIDWMERRGGKLTLSDKPREYTLIKLNVETDGNVATPRELC